MCFKVAAMLLSLFLIARITFLMCLLVSFFVCHRSAQSNAVYECSAEFGVIVGRESVVLGIARFV